MRIILILLSLWAWNAENRFALVVGNAAYQHVTELVTPHQDAKDVKVAFEALGFQSTLHLDVTTKSDFTAKLNAFLKLVKENAGGKVVYYSGHGLGHENVSFLVPVQANIEDAADIPEFAVDVEWVSNKIAEANKGGANVIILDACRDNPFKGIAGKSYAQGLVSISPKGSLVIYATEPGKKAFESKKARNSIFTQHLLAALNDPQKNRQSIFDMISDIGSQMDQTVKQLPWHAGLLRGKFCFGGCSNEQTFIPPQQPIKPEKVIQSEPVQPVETKYTLTVESDVIGAEVFIGNKLIGKTPLNIQLTPAQYGLVIKYNGKQLNQVADMKQSGYYIKVSFKISAAKEFEEISSCSVSASSPTTKREDCGNQTCTFEAPKGTDTKFLDKEGCALDTDHDGVPDYKDRCPNTQPNVSVDIFGCPPEVTEYRTVLSSQEGVVNFDHNNFKLRLTSYKVLDKLSSIITEEVGHLKEVIIEGHADYSEGNDNRALRLSQQRAQSVVDYLVRKGIPKNKISAVGKGKQQLASTGTERETEEGMAKNRRVEITIRKIKQEVNNQ